MANSNVEKQISNNFPAKKRQIAAKSLNNYFNQLMLHFDLNNDDLFYVIDISLKEIKNKNNKKKWWQIF